VLCNEAGGIGSTPNVVGLSPLRPKAMFLRFDKIPFVAIVLLFYINI
jgi:hypothetical protein